MARTIRVRLTRKDPETGIEYIMLVLEPGERKVISPSISFDKACGAGLPGGRAQDGEDPYLAAERELREETGLKAKMDWNPAASIPHGPDHTIIVFEATDPVGVAKPQDPQIVAAKWVPLHELQDPEPVCEHEGNFYPVYKSHLSLIHRRYDLHPNVPA